MTSVTDVSLSLARAVATINDASPPDPWLLRLEMADHVIWWGGAAIVAVAAIVWLARSRRDPLALAPIRPNRLLPEHIILLMVAFLVTVTILQTPGL